MSTRFQGLVKILKLMFRQDFEAKVWSLFCYWGLVVVMKFCWNADVWLRFWSWCLVEFLKMFDQDLCKNLWYDLKSYFGKQNSTLGCVVPLAMFKSPSLPIKPHNTIFLSFCHSLSFSFCPIVVSSFCLLFVHLSSFKFIFVQFDLSIFLFFTGRYWAAALDGLRSSFRSLKVDLDQS